MIALLAPGQGSQSSGMLEPWLELDGARERVATWSEVVGLDLLRLGTTADAEEIKDTRVTQPLVVALSLLAVEELGRRVELPAASPVVGHSVGELAAAAVGGVLTTDDAVVFAAVRGQAMTEACAAEPTGMSAVLGGDPEEVLAALARHGLEAANRNGAGQIVAAGPLDALSALAEDRPDGARIVPLPVAGAFHTQFMAPAERILAEHAATLAPKNPIRPLLSNADGEVVQDGAEVLRRLVAQVTRPVRWDLCMLGLHRLSVTATVELPPAGALSGLVKRELPGTVAVPLREPADLDQLAGLVSDHSGSPAT
ncbi:MAG: ACP S-malonyltransferase [Actinomycetota bacterium]|nr:ACP S-malonyltransferase [Actinomycetota bacterium]